MDVILTAIIFLSVLKATHGFNVDPVAWKTLTKSAAGFGAKVVQRQNDLLVSAPLEQNSESRGKIYKCSTSSCNVMQITVPTFAVNMSLGLSMAIDPMTQNTMVCGPTIPKDCKSITLYKGTCMQIDKSNNVRNPVISTIDDCPSQADIAFLLDGSGSIYPEEFSKMKQFLTSLVGSFVGKDTKFAIAQFSDRFTIHYHFNTFGVTQSWQTQISSIRQLGGATYTAAGIKRVVNEIFVENRGSRNNVKKVLIVITDGQSHDAPDLKNAANLAQTKQIIRFAIGVGRTFTSSTAQSELIRIGSSPSSDHVFKVDNFDALEQIRNTLQDRIFSIEGSQSGGESLKMELAQEGFNVAYTPGGFQITTIGANEWKGGFLQYSSTNTYSYTYGPKEIESDSYLGYAIAVAKTRSGTFTVVGAPRYQHRGVVMVVTGADNYKKIDPFPFQFQSGEYFGAEVCAMDVNIDSFTDIILISAPMYIENDREGRVYVCSIIGLSIECRFDSPLVLRGAPDNGRFGSSLAVLPDVNKDGFNDLAVGAPLENERRGSIYIFHGEGGGKINPTYSQRIVASEVGSGLKYFGMSISPTSFDLSGDNLPDLAVGSKGAVVLLRSQPIVMISTAVTFNPKEIPIQNPDCSNPIAGTARVCFTMTTKSGVSSAQANINFTFTLDATRKSPNNRAFIREKQQEETRSVQLNLNQARCSDINFFIESCPEDALNPLSNELRYMFEGLPSSGNLRPSLLQPTQTAAIHQLGFEINCGTDNKCVDKLKVDFNFTRSTEVRVGIDELLNLTVSVENKDENSYNSRVILTYPAELSYRKFTSVKGRIECNSLDSEDGVTRGRTDCTIDKPIFRSNTQAFFIVSYGIDTRSQLNRKIFFTTNATSGNREHSTESEPYKRREIGVKYSIFMTLESTLSYSNFTYGKNDLEKPVQQTIKVSNDIRALNFTVVIRVPVRLGDKDIWTDSNNLEIQDCERHNDEEPTVTDFIPQIQKYKFVNCSVARCSVFKCTQFMGRLESKHYIIAANLSSAWIQQIGLESAKFLLTSTASLEYDQDQYIFYSPGSNNKPPVRKIEAEVEVYPEPDFTKEIIGGSLGGVAFLVLLTAGLYKAGFFKSKYQDMIKNDAEGASPAADVDEPPAPEE